MGVVVSFPGWLTGVGKTDLQLRSGSALCHSERSEEYKVHHRKTG